MRSELPLVEPRDTSRYIYPSAAGVPVDAAARVANTKMSGPYAHAIDGLFATQQRTVGGFGSPIAELLCLTFGWEKVVARRPEHSRNVGSSGFGNCLPSNITSADAIGLSFGAHSKAEAEVSPSDALLAAMIAPIYPMLSNASLADAISVYDRSRDLLSVNDKPSVVSSGFPISPYRYSDHWMEVLPASKRPAYAALATSNSDLPETANTFWWVQDHDAWDIPPNPHEPPITPTSGDGVGGVAGGYVTVAAATNSLDWLERAISPQSDSVDDPMLREAALFISRQIAAGELVILNDILMSLEAVITRAPTDFILAVLRFTFSVRAKLDSWRPLRDALWKRLTDEGARPERLMSGL